MSQIESLKTLNNTQSSAVENRAKNITKLRFADGSVAWFPHGSVFDFVLAPTFLKYVAICIVLFSMLTRRDDVEMLDAWEQVALWCGILVTVIFWFTFAISMIMALRRVVPVRVIYTPLLTVPCVLINEWTSHVLLQEMLPNSVTLLSFNVEYMMQAVIVMILFDVLFGSFVAAHHPFLKVGKQGAFYDQVPPEKITLTGQRVTASFATPPYGVSPSDPKTVATGERKSETTETGQYVTIAGRQIAPASLILLKIEDHYLRIETDSQIFIERYKLRDAVAEIDAELGVQINRSTWVARSQIASFIPCRAGTPVITLKTGTEFTVSRSRLKAVMGACDRWNIKPDRKI